MKSHLVAKNCLRSESAPLNLSKAFLFFVKVQTACLMLLKLTCSFVIECLITWKHIFHNIKLSVLNCVPCMLKTCSHANVPYMLTCSSALCAYLLMSQRALCAYMLKSCTLYVLTCSQANVPCVLTCSCANVPCVLTCLRALHAYVLMCQCALVLMFLHALRACMLMFKRAILNIVNSYIIQIC